jgi:hypothetical protein
LRIRKPRKVRMPLYSVGEADGGGMVKECNHIPEGQGSLGVQCK